MPNPSHPNKLRRRVQHAITSRVKTELYTLLQPAVEDVVWRTFKDVSNFELQSSIVLARRTLSSSFQRFSNARPDLAIPCAHTLQQFVFSQTTLKAIVKRSDFQIETDSSVVLSRFFLLFVDCVHKSLDQDSFYAWFLQIFKPLIEIGEAAYNLEDDDFDSDDEDEVRPSKKAKMSAYGKYGEVTHLLYALRDQRRVLSSTQNTDSPSSNCLAVDSGKGIPTTPPQKSPYPRRPSSLPVPSATPAPSLEHFAPRLSPEPLKMPGAWVSSPTRPIPASSRVSLGQATSDTYSRFPRRSSANSTIHHYCPLNMPAISSRQLSTRPSSRQL